MPVSFPHQIIFIHIPKTGGSSVDFHLREIKPVRNRWSLLPEIPAEKFTNEELMLCIARERQHYTYRDLEKILPSNILDNFKKITVVRNPYDRLVSEYHFVNEEKNYLTFENFVKNTLSLDAFDRTWLYHGHLETQTSYLINREKNFNSIDFIFTFEKLHECFDYLKSVTGSDLKPHLRKALNRRPYKEYYNESLKELVYNFYKEDFVNFNYSADL